MHCIGISCGLFGIHTLTRFCIQVTATRPTLTYINHYCKAEQQILLKTHSPIIITCFSYPLNSKRTALLRVSRKTKGDAKKHPKKTDKTLNSPDSISSSYASSSSPQSAQNAASSISQNHFQAGNHYPNSYENNKADIQREETIPNNSLQAPISDSPNVLYPKDCHRV